MKKWIVSNSYGSWEFDSVQGAQDFIRGASDAESCYDDMLDDCYGDVTICGLDCSASLALKRTDNIAYRCGFDDYVDAVFCDVDFDNMGAGDEVEVFGLTVTCKFASDDEDAK